MEIDEVAIGGGSGAQMGETAAQKADNSGPLEERLVNKGNWAVRAKAFEELTGIFNSAPDNSKSEHFMNSVDKFKIYFKDSNPGALEKSLDCFEAFLKKVDPKIIGEEFNPILAMMIEKCIGHAKPAVKSKSKECLLLMYEVVENFTDSIETLLGLCKHKNVKVSLSSNFSFRV